MITSFDEYVYVTGANIDAQHPNGDIDRLPTGITGDIMPLRTGLTATGVSRKKLLKGEDIAFLLEGMREREKLSGYSGGKSQFSRKVNYWLPYVVAYDLQYYIGGFLYQHPTEQFNIGTTVPPFNRRTAADLTCDYNDFATGKKLVAANIQKMFDDLKLMVKAVTAPTKTDGTYFEEVNSLNPDYPYSVNAMSTIDFASGDLASHPDHKFCGNGYGVTPMTFTHTFDVEMNHVELWSTVEMYEAYHDHSTTPEDTVFIDDFIKLGDLTTTDNKTWGLTLSMPQFKARLNQLHAFHYSRGEFHHDMIGQQAPYNTEYYCGMDVKEFHTVVDLGDHTKWW